MSDDIRDAVLAAQAMGQDLGERVGRPLSKLQTAILDFGPAVQELRRAVRGTNHETHVAQIQAMFADLGGYTQDAAALTAALQQELTALAVRMNGA